MRWPWAKRDDRKPNYFQRTMLGIPPEGDFAVTWETAMASSEFIRQRHASAWMWVYPVIVPQRHISVKLTLHDDIESFLSNHPGTVFWTTSRAGWIIRFYKHQHALLFSVLFG